MLTGRFADQHQGFDAWEDTGLYGSLSTTIFAAFYKLTVEIVMQRTENNKIVTNVK